MPKVDIEELIRERGSYCEACGDEPASELHHCLIHRMKGVPELDCKENFQLVGHKCHHVTGKANSSANRVAFWYIQCNRYGLDHMKQWLDSLPLKIKPRF